MLYKSIFRIISGKKLKKQDERKANYYRQRRPEDSLINPPDITFKKLTLLLRATSNLYPSPYVIHNNKKIIIKKIKISKSNLNFKSENILISSNKIFIKLKDKVIKIIKTK